MAKCSITGVFQSCISPKEGQQFLLEIHAGVYGHHAAPRTRVNKAFLFAKQGSWTCHRAQSSEVALLLKWVLKIIGHEGGL